MKYMVNKSFAGTPVSGHKGKEVEIKSKKVADDLIKAGYIKPIEENSSKKASREKNNEDK